MQYTANYNLKKPEGADPVNIQDFNDNADSLDTELKKRVLASGGDISNTKIASADSVTTEFPVPAAGDTPKTFLGKMKKFAEDFRNLKTGLLTVGMIVNNCVTNNANLPLSAAQGKVLMDAITQLNGDLGVLRSGARKTANSDTDLENILNSSENEKITILMLAINYINNPVFDVFGSASGGTGCLISYRSGKTYGSALFFGYGTGIAKNDLIGGAWSGWVKI